MKIVLLTACVEGSRVKNTLTHKDRNGESEKDIRRMQKKNALKADSMNISCSKLSKV